MPSTRKNYTAKITGTDSGGDKMTFMVKPKSKVYVSAYAVSRHFGGHEEGGWWYDWWTHVATYPRRVKACRRREVVEKMRKRHGHIQSRRGRYSVIGGDDLVVVSETVAGEARSTSAPHYE